MVLDIVEGQKSEGVGPEMAKIHYGVKISRKQGGTKMPKFNMEQNRTSLNVPTTAQHKHTTTHNNTIMRIGQIGWPKMEVPPKLVSYLYLPSFSSFFFVNLKIQKIGRSRNGGGFEQVRFYTL